LAQACGNFGKTTQRDALLAGNDPGFNLTADGNYTCPLSPNATPQPDPGTGVGFYRVCRGNSDKTMLEVHGTSDTQSICVIPVQAVTDSNGNVTVYPQVDPKTSYPTYSCFPISSPTAAFPGFTFNAVFITSPDRRQQMIQSLLDKNWNEAPQYSWGYLAN
jgi:hypothetical protein